MPTCRECEHFEMTEWYNAETNEEGGDPLCQKGHEPPTDPDEDTGCSDWKEIAPRWLKESR